MKGPDSSQTFCINIKDEEARANHWEKSNSPLSLS